LVIAPTTLVTSLLYYFGWTSAKAQFSYFAVDQPALRLSTTDYVLRSVNPMAWPLITLALVSVFALLGHALVMHVASAGPTHPPLWLPLTIAAAGFVAFAQGLFGGLPDPPVLRAYGFLLPPLYLAVGIALVAYGLYLGRRFLLAASQRDLLGEVPAWVVQAMLVLTVFLVLVFVFAAIARYADAYGRTVAQRTARELEKQTSVTIYSKERLFIQAPGVQESQLRGADAAYKYRYSGLRLLAWSNDRYFLLPDGWSSAAQVTIIVPDSDTLRVEFTHGTR
jgi:hypothetical protein